MQKAVNAVKGGVSNLVIGEKRGNIFNIRLNRPERKNALTLEMYQLIVSLLHEAGKDQTTRITVLTSTGDYFSSGRDLLDARSEASQSARQSGGTKEFVASFIDHPKPLIALVHAPVVGIVATVLALCDATFHAPFTTLGLVPEGCSSFTFPRIMGMSKAAEMLLFGKKITAQEACERNLVAKVFPSATFERDAWKMVEAYAQLPPQSLVLGKTLVRDTFRPMLHDAFDKEASIVEERFGSEENVNALRDFFQSQQAKKAKL